MSVDAGEVEVCAVAGQNLSITKRATKLTIVIQYIMCTNASSCG